MQIVIDINDNTYEAIKHEYCISPPRKGLLKVLWDAIQNGTPLPKGHGRLFDEKDIVNGNYEIIANKIYELEPIIEADKAKRRMKND